MNCETCKERKMQADPVPYVVHESSMMRADRANKRLWIALILVIALLVGSNIGWLIYESQFEDIVVEQEVDTGIGDATITGVGDINYGASETESEGS